VWKIGALGGGGVLILAACRKVTVGKEKQELKARKGGEKVWRERYSGNSLMGKGSWERVKVGISCLYYIANCESVLLLNSLF
jgi:hypothetical protein